MKVDISVVYHITTKTSRWWGSRIFTIGNKLVYNKGNYLNHQMTRIVEVIVDEDRDVEITYTTFEQEDIVAYEQDEERKEGFAEFARVYQTAYEITYRRELDIREYTTKDIKAASRYGMGRKGNVRRSLSCHFENEQDRRGDSSKSRRNVLQKIV